MDHDLVFKNASTKSINCDHPFKAKSMQRGIPVIVFQQFYIMNMGNDYQASFDANVATRGRNDSMDPSEELKIATNQFFEYLNSGKLRKLASFYARDEGIVVVGTDPKELWYGSDVHNKKPDEYPEDGDPGFKIYPGEMSAFAEGTIGWTAAPHANWETAGGTIIPIRITTIFHQEDGEWRILHLHYSVPVPNERADEFKSEKINNS